MSLMNSGFLVSRLFFSSEASLFISISMFSDNIFFSFLFLMVCLILLKRDFKLFIVLLLLKDFNFAA